MNMQQVKRDIIHCCHRMYQRGYVASNDGNVSVRISEDRVITTPTGMSKGFLSADQLIITDMDGKKVSGTLRPSSEIKMHIMVYRERADVKSVVHAHPVTATGFAVAGIPLSKCVLPEAVIVLGVVPIVPYGTPSTDEIPNAIKPLIQDYDAFLLENHGALTIGSNVIDAYHKMETIEHFAQISLVARQLGQENTLSKEQVVKLMQVRERLGVKSHITGCYSCNTTPQGEACTFMPAAGKTAPSVPADLDTLVQRITAAVKQQLAAGSGK
jgi:L-fuculose-phosphate aldolase